MRGLWARVGAALTAVVGGCVAWLLIAGIGASSAAPGHRSVGGARRPVAGVVLGRPGLLASGRHLRASMLRVPGARGHVLRAQTGAKVAWRSRAESNTFLAGSGRLETRIYPYAVNYRAPSGQFVPIHARLIAGRGGYRQQANDLGLRLPRSAARAARLSVAGGGLSLRLLGATGRGVVSGTIERFAGPSGLTYVSEGDGLGWQAQMSGAGPSWLVRGSAGLSARLVSRGVAFRNAAGKVVWMFRAPTAHQQDATTDESVRLSLRHTARGLVIHARVADAPGARPQFSSFELSSAASGAMPDATGPATVTTWDGQIVAGTFSYLTNAQQTGDCYIDSNSPTTSFCGGNTNYVGPDDNTLENFDVVDNLPSDVQVLQSWVSMQVSSMANTSSEEIGVWQAAYPWTDDATWDSYDGTQPWQTAGGNVTGPMLDQVNIYNGGGGLGYWDITSAMQSWVDQVQPTNGLIFQATQGASATNTIGFYTSTAAGTSNTNPYIMVYWEPRMGDYPNAKYDSQQLTNRSSMGVNVANGNLMVSNNDLSLAGINGLGLSIGRYYNNLSTDQDAFGVGWSMGAGADTYLAIPSDTQNTVVYFDGTGDAQTFNTGVGGTTELSPPGLDAQLSMNVPGNANNSSTYSLLFRHSGITETFTAPANASNKIARLTSISDRNGNTINYGYNSSNQLTSITDSYGNTTTIAWSTSGYISQITDPTGRVYKYVQNTAGQLTQYEDPAGNTTNYTYDSYGNLTQIKSPAGRITNITYDAGNTNQVESVQRLVAAANTTGPTWTYQTGPTRACVLPGPGWSADTVEDPDRHETIYCTDDLSRLAEVFNASGVEESASYNTDGYVASETSQLGTPTTFSYSGDGDDNVTQIQDGATNGGGGPGTGTGSYGAPETASYSYTGTAGTANQYLPSSTTNAAGGTTNYQYGTGAAGSYGAGEPTTITDGLATQNQATLTYNPNGTVKTSTDPDGNETTYGYNAAGNLLTSVTPPTGSNLSTIQLTYDSANRLATASTISGVTGHKVAYSYNTLDQETQAVYTNAAGTKIETVGYTYDADGNLTKITDYIGSKTSGYSYTYDGLDRLTSQTLATGGAATYTLDPAGNIKQINGPGGKTNYTYNILNEVTSVTDPSQTKPIATFTYDASGDLLNTVYPSGASDDNLYNGLGELTQTNDSYKTTSGTTAHLSYSYNYTTGGLINSVTDQANNQTNYAYDALQRLTQAQTDNSAGATTAQYNYTYDGDGNMLQDAVTGSAVTNGTTSDAYNAGNEICWSYNGSSTTGCGTPPPGADTGYSYDGDGNELSNGNGLSMTYNALGQTTSITSGGTTTNYGYVGEGQGGLSSEGATTIDTEPFGIDATTSNGTASYYTRTPSGQLVDEWNASGTYNYLFDGQGNVVALTNSAGQLAKTYTYSPSGAVTSSTGSAANPFGYGAGYTTTSGLIHFGQRFLNPGTQSWTQEDPLMQVSDLTQLDRYVYSGDDPVNSSDPSGQCDTTCPGSGFSGTSTSNGVTLDCGAKQFVLSAGHCHLIDHGGAELLGCIRGVTHESKTQAAETAELPIVGDLAVEVYDCVAGGAASQ